MKIKKTLVAGCLLASMAAMMVTPVFASSNPNGTGTASTGTGSTPAYITISEDALVGQTLDVSVTLKMEFAAASTMTFAPLDYTITSNMKAGSVTIKSVKAQDSGWTIGKKSLETLKALPLDSKEATLMVEDEYLSDGLTVSDQSFTLAPGAHKTLSVGGYHAPQKSVTNAGKIADIVATVALTPAT